MRCIQQFSLSALVAMTLSVPALQSAQAALPLSYASMVNFGDSHSDVGTYRVGAIAAAGGGEYTVNGRSGRNWTENLAKLLLVAAPCPAQTGLNSIIPGIPAVPVVDHPECLNYAQGGSRVTNPVGSSNLQTYPADPGGALGQLTVPVVQQIRRHLALHGDFSGRELVTVLAGGNDVIANLNTANRVASAAAQDPLAMEAANAQAIQAMSEAGTELADDVRSLVSHGARYIAVLNLPDVAQTPYAYAQPAQAQSLISKMVKAYNTALSQGLQGERRALLLDIYTQGHIQTTAPWLFGITNMRTPACDLGKTLLPSSLTCTDATLVSGDTSRYAFSDSMHPTPYGHKLLSLYVFEQLLLRGWLAPLGF